jgi:tetratricopeptide repeat protein 8
MDKFTLAMSRFKRNKFEECIILCDELTKLNEKDLAAQLLKTHAIRRKNHIDDLEIDDEGLGDKLLDEHKISNQAKPGTSFSGSKGVNQAVRPMSSSGRPLSGVVRPNSRAQNQDNKSSSNNRMQTSSNNRMITSGGRNVRIATATLQNINSSSPLNINDINVKNLVKKRSLAKVFLYFLNKKGSS